MSRETEKFRILRDMPLVTRDQVIAFIEAAMQKLGVTRTELARRANVHPSTINKFFKNPAASDLGMKTIAKISDISGLPFPVITHTVTKARHRSGSVDLGQAAPIPGTSSRDLPVFGEDRVGNMGYAFEDPTPLGFVERPSYLTSDRAYALRIKDETMSPRFRAGELIYVDPTRPAVPGDEIVVRLKDQTGFVKLLVARELERIRVRSYAEAEESTFVNDEIEGIHVVVGVSLSA